MGNPKDIPGLMSVYILIICPSDTGHSLVRVLFSACCFALAPFLVRSLWSRLHSGACLHEVETQGLGPR